MVATFSGKQKIFIETPDGNVTEVTGYVDNMNITHEFDYSNLTGWGGWQGFAAGGSEVSMSIEFRGCEVKHTTATLTEKRRAPEWKCDYCGRPNQRANETCKSCGAVRSFIWG